LPSVNTPFVAAGVSGLSMTSTAVAPGAYNYGQLVIAAMTGTGSKVGVIPAGTSEADLFAQFSGHKEVDPATAAPTRPSTAGLSWAGAATHAVRQPQPKISVSFDIRFFICGKGGKGVSRISRPYATPRAPWVVPMCPTCMHAWYSTHMLGTLLGAWSDADWRLKSDVTAVLLLR